VPLRIPTDKHVRARIVNAATWLVAHNRDCTYSEGADRFSCVHKPYEVPFVSDCSSGVTDCYSWGGAPDPNNRHYDGEGYTGTLIAEGHLIATKSARAADVFIFGPDPGWHAALVVTPAKDPILWSMGEQGDPRLYPLSVVAQAVAYVHGEATCMVRCFRYLTNALKGK
jgi:hypothetical protein